MPFKTREQERAYARAYREANADKIRESARRRSNTYRNRHPEAASKNSRKWYQKNRDRERIRGLRCQDATQELLDSRWTGYCAICESLLDRSSTTTHIDHCHAKNRVRGWLCAGCNSLISRFDDCSEAMRLVARKCFPKDFFRATRLVSGADYVDFWAREHETI